MIGGQPTLRTNAQILHHDWGIGKARFYPNAAKLQPPPLLHRMEEKRHVCLHSSGLPLSSVLSPLLRRGGRKKRCARKSLSYRRANLYDCSIDFAKRTPSVRQWVGSVCRHNVEVCAGGAQTFSFHWRFAEASSTPHEPQRISSTISVGWGDDCFRRNGSRVFDSFAQRASGCPRQTV